MHQYARDWMRELARVRAQAAKLRTARSRDDDAIGVIDDALQLFDSLRNECAALQERCTELERRQKARDEGGRRLLDAMPQPIVITDESGVILDANRAACLLLSRSRGKLIGDLLLHFAEDREGFSGIVRELPYAARTVVSRARFRPNDHAPFEARVTVLRDPRGETRHWLWLMERQA